MENKLVLGLTFAWWPHWSNYQMLAKHHWSDWSLPICILDIDLIVETSTLKCTGTWGSQDRPSLTTYYLTTLKYNLGNWSIAHQQDRPCLWAAWKSTWAPNRPFYLVCIPHSNLELSELDLVLKWSTLGLVWGLGLKLTEDSPLAQPS